jgi:hypothetical protein
VHQHVVDPRPIDEDAHYEEGEGEDNVGEVHQPRGAAAGADKIPTHL